MFAFLDWARTPQKASVAENYQALIFLQWNWISWMAID